VWVYKRLIRSTEKAERETKKGRIGRVLILCPDYCRCRADAILTLKGDESSRSGATRVRIDPEVGGGREERRKCGEKVGRLGAGRTSRKST
jgi:hypothetical protein